ncbi:MAG: sugar nucleotide-binding protein, partial [Patescibacteria group bacterium]
VNVEGVRNILDAIDPQKTHFIQISTDYVFSGSEDDPGPYTEDHPTETDPNKLTWYGYTKAEAERLVLERLESKATILRIIYPVRKEYEKKLDYLRKSLKQYKEGNLPPLFTDQQISITFIDEACKALAKIISQKHKGIFHAGSSNTTTPYELITFFIEKVSGERPQLTARKMGELAGRYPKSGGLSVEKTENVLEMRFSSSWQTVDKIIV